MCLAHNAFLQIYACWCVYFPGGSFGLASSAIPTALRNCVASAHTLTSAHRTATNEYQLCVDATGDKKNPKCAQRYRDALTLCPQDTVSLLMPLLRSCIL